ncbi:hypothetical protein R0K17_20710, partial [Planococcus sp. SIMBA_143]
MTLDNRVKSMRRLLGPDDNVTILKLDETHIPRYPHGWDPWLKMLAETSLLGIDALPFSVGEMTYYVGEEESTDPLQDFF